MGQAQHGSSENIYWLENAEGPDLVAYVLDGMGENKAFHTVESDWHSHVRGQFFYLEKGLISVRTAYGAWTLPPHRVGWPRAPAYSRQSKQHNPSSRGKRPRDCATLPYIAD